MAAQTVWDKAFAHLIAALEAISASTSDASTTVDQDSAAAGTTLYVTATTGFTAGQWALINRGGAREETVRIDTVNAGVSLTVSALAYTHTLAQADAVEQGWYWHTVANAKSFAGLFFPMDGAAPLCGATAGPIKPYEGGQLMGQTQNWTRSVQVALLDLVADPDPLDQTIDIEFSKCLHDIIRAVTRARQRGGNAMETRIVGAEPIDEDYMTYQTSEMKWAGALVSLEIDYRHQYGDLYA